MDDEGMESDDDVEEEDEEREEDGYHFPCKV